MNNYFEREIIIHTSQDKDLEGWSFKNNKYEPDQELNLMSIDFNKDIEELCDIIFKICDLCVEDIRIEYCKMYEKLNGVYYALP
jgi:hypothetical protein